MKTAIIIGAGPAGLTAAYELLKQTDIKPIVIEADSQVGGISKTIDYKGNKIDIGGHRFFSKSEKIINWWLHFLPLEQTGITDLQLQYQNNEARFSLSKPELPNTCDRMLLRPRKSRIFYQRKFFDYPLQLNGKTIRNLGVRKIIKVAMAYTRAKLFPIKPENNLADFFKNRFGQELYLTFFKDYTEKVWGQPCEQIPASWGRQRIKDLNISRLVLHAISALFYKKKDIQQKGTSTSLIEQFLYPQYGPGQMWETVAKEIEKSGGEIRLNTRVTGITGNNNNLIKSVRCCNKLTKVEEECSGDYFFSTMPIKELIDQMQELPIPAAIHSISSGLQYRDFIIVGLLVKKLAVTDKDSMTGTITDNWIYIQDNTVKAGRLQVFNNWSPFMVKDSNTVWLGVEYFCNERDLFWQLKDDEIVKLAITEMVAIGILQTADVLDAMLVRVPKAYPSYYGAYHQFDQLRSYLDSIENLFLIGRNGMHRYNNSDHSMLTAMEAVGNIVLGRKDKTNIWEVNTEEDYHEEK